MVLYFAYESYKPQVDAAVCEKTEARVAYESEKRSKAGILI